MTKTIRYVEGKTCGSCGRKKRRASNRRCVFCEFWDACLIIEGKVSVSKAANDRAWQSFLELSRDHRVRQTRRTASNTRRGRKVSAPGRFTKHDAQMILDLQNGCCAYCHATVNLHLDHATPLSRGGSNWPWNLQWLCGSHNSSKGTRTDAEYRAIAGLPEVQPVSTAIWKILLASI